jgi:hypothetical protein
MNKDYGIDYGRWYLITRDGMMKKDKYVKILPFDLWKDKIEFTKFGIKLKDSHSSHLFSSYHLS